MNILGLDNDLNLEKNVILGLLPCASATANSNFRMKSNVYYILYATINSTPYYTFTHKNIVAALHLKLLL